MDEPRTPRLDWTDFRLIVLLTLLTLGLRAIQLATTEVTARDSISYIHIAWRLEHGDWLKILPAAPQHPGYPIAVLAASVPARLFFPNDLPYAMQLGAQLASAAAGALLVVPLYWLGRQLFSARVAFGAVLLFQCLPCSGRILADGLSEGVFLLFAVTALATAMYALRTGSIFYFSLSGAAGGLAYLTRPEGLLIPAAAGLVLLGMQVVAAWRRPWRRVLACGAALTIAVLIVSGPYMVLIHGLTVKNSSNAIMHDAAAQADEPASGVSEGPVFASWYTGDPNNTAAVRVWGAKALAEELAKAFFFVFWVPALAGVVCFHRRFRTTPGAWLLLLVCGVLGCLLYVLAARMKYLSDRHTILILACGVPWAAAALDGVGVGLARLWARLRSNAAAKPWADGRAWAMGLLLLVAAVPLVRTLEPLHGDRVGFRAAGCWLRQHAAPDETVCDPFGWAGYYAGRYFREDSPVYHEEAGYPDGPWNYVVVEKGTNGHSHLVTVARAEELARRCGPPICTVPAPRGKEMAEIEIYRAANP
jgi:4-amino-4-deoxy-L-arabinose transferase-like glycosyltransferase